jgi:thymidylate synthase (FAD)
MSQVRLIALSQPVDLEGISYTEELVAYCARVSNPANQNNHQTNRRLLNYLIHNKHWSPFEMAHVVMEIETTRDIARQILRHRSFSFQEFSQRYAVVKREPIMREARLQDHKNRQNSLETDDFELTEWWADMQSIAAGGAESLYQEALQRGIAKEVARAVLPEGLTSSSLYMAGTVRSWIHYVQLRTGNGTQKEHREVASKCRDELYKAMPSLKEILSGEAQHD